MVDASGLSRIMARMTTPKGLTRGARATFYRDGHELYSACDIPVAGAFVTRELPPGQWVCKDSTGGEQAFTVKVGEELTVILDGDTVGVTGGPGLSGSAESPSLRVGPGGGVFSSVDQVAAGEGITGPIKRVDGEAPSEVAAPVGKADRPRLRPRDPGSDERVPGQAGSPLVQDAPIRSVAENMEESERLLELDGRDPDATMDETLAHLESGVEVPLVIKPPASGPEPLESTLPPAGYGERPAEPTPVFERKVA